MTRKKESLPPVSSQEMEEKKVRKKSRVKEPPHQTSEPETNKVDLQDLNADAKSAQKKSIVSRKKKQVETVDSSLESSLTSKPKKTTEPTQEAISPETTKPKRKRRTKAEMEAARKELEIRKVEKETEVPEKKKRRKKEDVTEDVKKEAKPKEVKKKTTSKETSKESEHTEPKHKPEHKESKKKANQKEMSNESMRNEEQNNVVPTEVQTKKETKTKDAQTKKEVQTQETQTASKPAKKPKKSRKKELIYAVCLKNGGEMVVEEAGEKTRKKYEGAMYELMISDTLAVLKKSDVPSARIKPMEEDMYYEINDDLYHVEFYRNGRRIG